MYFAVRDEAEDLLPATPLQLSAVRDNVRAYGPATMLPTERDLLRVSTPAGLPATQADIDDAKIMLDGLLQGSIPWRATIPRLETEIKGKLASGYPLMPIEFCLYRMLRRADLYNRPANPYKTYLLKAEGP